MTNQLKHWYNTLSQREQRLFVLGVIVVCLVLLWVGVYQPVNKRIAQQVDLNQRLQSQLNQMQNLVGEVASDELEQVQPIPANMTFSSWIDQQLQSVNLQQMVNRTEPINADSLSVWLQGAPFNQVIDWLQNLSEKYAVQVDQIDVTVVDVELGLTDIRMRLVK